MSDAKRVAQLYEDFVSRTRIYVDHEYPSWEESLKSLRIRYWYEMLRQRTALDKAYQLEQFFEPRSFARDAKGAIKYYRNKWIRYEHGLHKPQDSLLKKVEAKVPGSTRDLHHPLWSVLDLTDVKVMRGHAFLKQLAPDVQNVLFQSAQDGMLSYEVRAPITPLLLEKLERRACLDVLACLVWLLRETAEKQASDSVRIWNVLHNVLTIMALELDALKIGLPLLRLFIDHILPLGVPRHSRMWMIPCDYLHSSGNLNLLVFSTLKGTQHALDWKKRVEIMQELLKGNFGHDVRCAMSPQFELHMDVGEIPPEVVSAHDRASRLRNWGWKCITSGRPGRLPPPELM